MEEKKKKRQTEIVVWSGSLAARGEKRNVRFSLRYIRRVYVNYLTIKPLRYYILYCCLKISFSTAWYSNDVIENMNWLLWSLWSCISIESERKMVFLLCAYTQHLVSDHRPENVNNSRNRWIQSWLSFYPRERRFIDAIRVNWMFFRQGCNSRNHKQF